MTVTNVWRGDHFENVFLCPLCDAALTPVDWDYFDEDGRWLSYICPLCDTQWTAQALIEVYNTTEDYSPDPFD